jgi:hypothetical protein
LVSVFCKARQIFDSVALGADAANCGLDHCLRAVSTRIFLIALMQYRLRTLLIVLALGPPVLAWAWIYRLEVGVAVFVLAIYLLYFLVMGSAITWTFHAVGRLVIRFLPKRR